MWVSSCSIFSWFVPSPPLFPVWWTTWFEFLTVDMQTSTSTGLNYRHRRIRPTFGAVGPEVPLG